MPEENKLPVQDDETKIDTAETSDELSEGDLDKVAGGGPHTVSFE